MATALIEVLGLPGYAWADGEGMTRLRPQLPEDLEAFPASILEAEIPAGGNERRA
jgi:hypothetical protein